HNPSYNGDQSAAGIYIDGGENIVISDNISANNDIGIEIASEHKNKNAVNILVKKNIIKNNGYTGIAIGGYNQTMGGGKKIRLLN
ncbi:right-handed parallel beta-helix repeat-containing protein, partial [Klebsiella pneumoniae]|uniref:right-handed parallel beta-helix repeat-containing protein n=2 Tax=Bacteria TaxID=2 RepID=UPI0023AFD7C9